MWQNSNKDYNPADTTDLYCLAGQYKNSDLGPYAWHDGSNENDSISAFWHSHPPLGLRLLVWR